MRLTIARSVAALLFMSLLVFTAGCVKLKLAQSLHQTEGDWPMFGKNISRTQQDTSVNLTFPMTLAWKYDASAGFGNGSPVIVDSILFIGTLQGEFHAVQISTGKRIGYKKSFYPVNGAPVIAGDLAIIAAEGAKESLFAFDLIGNDFKWRASLGSLSASPLLFKGNIYIGSTNGSFYSIDTLTGGILWNCDYGKPFRSTAVAVDSIIVAGNDDGTIMAFGQSTGTVCWKFKTGGAIFGSGVSDEKMVYFGSRDGKFYALDAKTGTLQWKTGAAGMIVGAPSLDGENVYVGSLDGFVRAFDKQTGRERWNFRTQSSVNTAPVVSKDAVIVTSLDTHLYALSRKTGELRWKFKIGNRIKTSPIIWRNMIFVAAEDRNIYCFVSEM
jgi:outer membrane protein assembly factor BamB